MTVFWKINLNHINKLNFVWNVNILMFINIIVITFCYYKKCFFVVVKNNVSMSGFSLSVIWLKINQIDSIQIFVGCIHFVRVISFVQNFNLSFYTNYVNVHKKLKIDSIFHTYNFCEYAFLNIRYFFHILLYLKFNSPTSNFFNCKRISSIQSCNASQVINNFLLAFHPS